MGEIQIQKVRVTYSFKFLHEYNIYPTAVGRVIGYIGTSKFMYNWNYNNWSDTITKLFPYQTQILQDSFMTLVFVC